MPKRGIIYIVLLLAAISLSFLASASLLDFDSSDIFSLDAPSESYGDVLLGPSTEGVFEVSFYKNGEPLTSKGVIKVAEYVVIKQNKGGKETKKIINRKVYSTKLQPKDSDIILPIPELPAKYPESKGYFIDSVSISYLGKKYTSDFSEITKSNGELIIETSKTINPKKKTLTQQEYQVAKLTASQQGDATPKPAAGGDIDENVRQNDLVYEASQINFPDACTGVCHEGDCSELNKEGEVWVESEAGGAEDACEAFVHSLNDLYSREGGGSWRARAYQEAGTNHLTGTALGAKIVSSLSKQLKNNFLDLVSGMNSEGDYVNWMDSLTGDIVCCVQVNPEDGTGTGDGSNDGSQTEIQPPAGETTPEPAPTPTTPPATPPIAPPITPPSEEPTPTPEVIPESTYDSKKSCGFEDYKKQNGEEVKVCNVNNDDCKSTEICDRASCSCIQDPKYQECGADEKCFEGQDGTVCTGDYPTTTGKNCVYTGGSFLVANAPGVCCLKVAEQAEEKQEEPEEENTDSGGVPNDGGEETPNPTQNLVIIEETGIDACMFKDAKKGDQIWYKNDGQGGLNVQADGRYCFIGPCEEEDEECVKDGANCGTCKKKENSGSESPAEPPQTPPTPPGSGGIGTPGVSCEPRDNQNSQCIVSDNDVSSLMKQLSLMFATESKMRGSVPADNLVYGPYKDARGALSMEKMRTALCIIKDCTNKENQKTKCAWTSEAAVSNAGEILSRCYCPACGESGDAIISPPVMPGTGTGDEIGEGETTPPGAPSVGGDEPEGNYETPGAPAVSLSPEEKGFLGRVWDFFKNLF